MKRRFVFRKGEFVELDLDAPLPPRRTPYIQSDIGAYRSVLTGEQITSRSEHREHLHRHGVIEVGNEKMSVSRPNLPSAREDLRAALDAAPERHAEARAASDRAAAVGETT